MCNIPDVLSRVTNETINMWAVGKWEIGGKWGTMEILNSWRGCSFFRTGFNSHFNSLHFTLLGFLYNQFHAVFLSNLCMNSTTSDLILGNIGLNSHFNSLYFDPPRASGFVQHSLQWIIFTKIIIIWSLQYNYHNFTDDDVDLHGDGDDNHHQNHHYPIIIPSLS